MRILGASCFDCDGTLVDSELLTVAAIAQEAARLGIADRLHEEIAALRGQRMAHCLGLVERKLGRALPDDFEDVVRAAMAQLFRQHLKAMPGALALVAALRLPICVATNGPRDKALLTLELAGLLPHFRARVSSAYDVGAWKPDPDLLLHAASAMGVSPEDCAVIDDSESGMRAGIAAGMQVFAFCPDSQLPVTLAPHVTLVRSFAEIEEALASLGVSQRRKMRD